MLKNVLKSKLFSSAVLLALLGGIIMAFYFYTPPEKDCPTHFREGKQLLDAGKESKALEAFGSACTKCPEVPIYCETLNDMAHNP